MNYAKKISVLFLLCLVAITSVADDMPRKCASEISDSEMEDKLYNVNMTGIGIVTLWGVYQWDYFSQTTHSRSEGWFAVDTDEGGVDKLGHFYGSYAASHSLSYLYESWCFNKRDATFYGALTSFALLGYMEFGDSFSDFGFSYEDFVMNALGSVTGYYLYENPSLARKIDIRWEYGLHPTDTDFFTDYENSKYLLALKLNGFESMRQGLLKYLELHIGYYVRGYGDPAASKERNIYVGLGINLSDLFRRSGHKKTAAILNYIQLPGTYVEFENNLNKK